MTFTLTHDTYTFDTLLIHLPHHPNTHSQPAKGARAQSRVSICLFTFVEKLIHSFFVASSHFHNFPTLSLIAFLWESDFGTRVGLSLWV